MLDEISKNTEIQKPRVWIKSITFANGLKLQLDRNDILVFVGPNNSGKTLSLNNLWTLFVNGRPGAIITKLELTATCSEVDARAWYVRNSFDTKSSPSIQDKELLGIWGTIQENHFRNHWPPAQNGLANLGGHFGHFLGTSERLSAANDSGAFDADNQPPTRPIQFMYSFDDVEQKISAAFDAAFNQKLTINKRAGNNIPLYVGTVGPPPGTEKYSTDHIREIRKLPRLATQGDGMRSYAGILLNLYARDLCCVFIDEPEAFLHPPQVRCLSKEIGTARDQQLFLATHSGDLLRGLLDYCSHRVRVIRLERSESDTQITELSNSAIKDAWRDPLMRYSHVFESIFHDRAVVCESDGDCRFYQAIADACLDRQPDWRFINVGGKDRLAMASKALRSLAVPVNVIADLDVLNESSKFKILVEALGGSWSDFEKDLKIVVNQIGSKGRSVSTAIARSEIEKAFANHPESTTVSEELASAVCAAVTSESAWSHIKRAGKSALPQGDATGAYDRLSSNLEDIGLFLVEVGEQEGFAKSVGGHGPSWVNKVLETKDLKTDGELDQARNFVRKIAEASLSRTTKSSLSRKIK